MFGRVFLCTYVVFHTLSISDKKMRKSLIEKLFKPTKGCIFNFAEVGHSSTLVLAFQPNRAAVFQVLVRKLQFEILELFNWTFSRAIFNFRWSLPKFHELQLVSKNEAKKNSPSFYCRPKSHKGQTRFENILPNLCQKLDLASEWPLREILIYTQFTSLLSW